VVVSVVVAEVADPDFVVDDDGGLLLQPAANKASVAAVITPTSLV
jgi:hypothetical protein